MVKHRTLGYQFEREVQEGLKKITGWFFKIPDSRTMQYKTTKVPADFLWCGKNKCVFIEAKSSSKKRFPLSNIKPHQLSDGNNICEKTCADYYFIFYLRYHKRCFLVSADRMIKEIDKKDSFKSLDISFFEEEGIEVERFTAKYNNGKCAFIDLKIIEKFS